MSVGGAFCPPGSGGISSGGVFFEAAPLKAFGRPRAPAPVAADLAYPGGKVEAFPFFGGTDSASNGLVADILSTQTSDLTIIAANAVPQYSTWKFYYTRVVAAVLGGTAWTASAGNNPGIQIKDTNGNGLVSIPLSALQPWAVYDIPTTEWATPYVFGSGTSYTLASVTPTTMVFSATTFVTTTLQGLWLRVTAGKGAGTSCLITSNTSTTLTVPSGFPATVDSTSIFAVDYLVLNGSPSTTSFTSLRASTNLILGNQWVVGVVGTCVNEVAPVLTTGSTAITAGYAVETAGVAGDLIRVTTAPQLNGVINFGVGAQNSVMSAGAGLVASLTGTISAGSPVRLYFEGYAAP